MCVTGAYLEERMFNNDNDNISEMHQPAAAPTKQDSLPDVGPSQNHSFQEKETGTTFRYFPKTYF